MFRGTNLEPNCVGEIKIVLKEGTVMIINIKIMFIRFYVALFLLNT